MPEEKKVPTGPSKLQEMQEKARQLASELKAMDAPAQTKKAKPAKALSSVELLRQEYLSKSRYQGPNKQERQLTEISEFSKKLKQAQAVPAAAHILPIDHNWECDLHFVKGCKSCRAADVDEEYDDKGWMQATLKFSKVADDVSVNVFKPKIDDYTVIDPRQG